LGTQATRVLSGLARCAWPSRAAALASAAALATVTLLLSPALQVAASDSATTWRVQAGNADDPTFTSTAQEVTAFYNARTFVHPGDDVLFTPVGGHTITFNPIRFPGVPSGAYANPNFPGGPTGNTLMFANRSGGALLNSGAFAQVGFGPPGLPIPSSFTLHIGADAAGVSGGDDAAGTTYKFVCMFHRDMTGFITVLPSGSRLPFTDLQNQARALDAMQADLARGSRALRKAEHDSEDGQVAAGLGLASTQEAGVNSILRFAPATTEINVGQSVTWTNRDINGLHTVTFGAEVPGDPNLPPGLVPYGGTVVSSTADQVNSGGLVSQELIDYDNVSSLLPTGFVVTRQVTFTFTKAGTYHYFCALHDFLGMTGTVIVRNVDDHTSG
jgi:plastocyanin